MNERSLNPFRSLRGKLLVAFVVAIFIPLALAAVLGISGATSINQQNLSMALLDSGTQQAALIRTEVEASTSLVQTYLTNNNNRTALQQALLPTQPGLPNRVIRLSRAQETLQTLVDSQPEWIIGAWIIPEGTNNPDIFVVNEESDFSNRDIQILGLESAPGVRAAELLTEETYRLVSGVFEGRPYLALANPLIVGSGTEARRLGFVAVGLDVTGLLIEPMVSDAMSFPHTMYITLPTSGARISADGAVLPGAGITLNPNWPAGSVNNARLGDGSSALVFFDRFATDLGAGLTLVITLETTVAQQQIFSYVSQVGFPVVVGAVVLLFILFQLLDQLISPPLRQLVDAMRGMVRGYYDAPLPPQGRQDEIGTLANAFAEMREKIKNLTEEMEERLQARIRDVQVTQNITRAITSERDLNFLMNQVVSLIVENFPQIYHAQIFLLDAAEEYAVLRASTGEVGKELLQRGHKLRVGSISVIGQVMELGERTLARDTASSNVHRRNEFLPDTRAELAIPLKLGNRVIGALDVQSRERNSFQADLISTMETLADQIAVAIENARLYEQSARLLADLQRQRRTEVRQSWEDYLRSRRVLAQTHRSGITTATDFSALTQAAYLSRKSIVGSVTDHNTVPFVVPIVMNDATIGAIEYEVPQADFSYNKVLLAEELVNRLAVSLENARLFQESQQTAQRERIVNDIAAKLALENEVHSILETALREVGQALRTPHVSIRLTPMTNGSSNGSQKRNGNGTHGSNGTHPAPPALPPTDE